MVSSIRRCPIHHCNVHGFTPHAAAWVANEVTSNRFGARAFLFVHGAALVASSRHRRQPMIERVTVSWLVLAIALASCGSRQPTHSPEEQRRAAEEERRTEEDTRKAREEEAARERERQATKDA